MSTIEIMTPFRSYTDKEVVMNVHSVIGFVVLEKRIQTHPVSLKDKKGNLRSFVNMDLPLYGAHSLDGMNIKVKYDEPLVIMPSISEGV